MGGLVRVSVVEVTGRMIPAEEGSHLPRRLTSLGGISFRNYNSEF